MSTKPTLQFADLALESNKGRMDAFIENIIRWLIAILFLLLITSICAVVGFRLDIIDTPQWWPWRLPPRTAQINLYPNTLPNGISGYAFVNSAFVRLEGNCRVTAV